MHKEIFRTHYNNNGDYDGFVFADDLALTDKDAEKIKKISEDFYNSMDIQLDVGMTLSIGTVRVNGRLNPYIDRRKETFCFLELQEPKIESVKDQKIPLSSNMKDNVKSWLTYCRPISADKERLLYTAIEHLQELINDPSCEIVPEIVLGRLYEAILESNSKWEDNNIRLLIEFVKQELKVKKPKS